MLEVVALGSGATVGGGTVVWRGFKHPTCDKIEIYFKFIFKLF